MDGIKSNRVYVEELLKSNQIIALQEHWLYNFEKQTLHDLFPDYNNYCKCSDDLSPIPPKVRPKGVAGVAFLWNQDLNENITPLPDGSDRVIAIHIQAGCTSAVLINTYMPANGTLSDVAYEEILDEVQILFDKYSPSNKIIWMGDMNATIREHRNNQNDQKFRKFLSENSLQTLRLEPDVDTYHHFIEGISSQIDYAITRLDHMDMINKVLVDIRNHLNTGPHDSLIIETNLQNEKRNNLDQKQPKQGMPRVKWDKVDTERYGQIVGEKLTTLIETTTPTTNLDVLVTRVNTILAETSTECQPRQRVINKTNRKNKKYAWHPSLMPLIRESKQVYYEWKQEGCPKGRDSPLYVRKQRAKQHLRQAQRRIAAGKRIEKYEEIMAMQVTHDQAFYKLMRQQRESPFCHPRKINFDDSIEGHDDTDRWANYFSELATPKDMPQFDKEYKGSVARQRQVLRSLKETEQEKVEIKEEQVWAHVKNMKNNKAADAFGITAEHLKYAGDPVIKILSIIAQTVVDTGHIPNSFKVGLSTPIPKKDKQETNPDKFRRITVSSLIGKIVESCLEDNSKAALEQSQNPRQYGFTREVSCYTAAMMMTEVIMDSWDTKQPLHMTFLDTSKAFDVVDHDSVMVHLYQQGVKGKIWQCYDELYRDITSMIKWHGNISPMFAEKQGIRQGAVTSPSIFKVRANPILDLLGNHPDGLTIGHLNLGALMVADDLVVNTRTRREMQGLIEMATWDAAKERYTFSKEKTRIVSLNHQDSQKVNLLGNEILESNNETHLGLCRTSSPNNMETIMHKISIARKTSYLLMGAGLHGTNGISPEVSRHVWSTFITPRLISGLEAIVISKKEMNLLEDFFRKNIRLLQVLPKATATPAIYLLMGIPPIEAQIHIKTICFFVNIVRRKHTLEYDLIQLQLAMKGPEAKSWVWYVQHLLKKYGLPSAFNLIHETPRKGEFKNLVKRTVLAYWENELKREARKKSTLSMININRCSLRSPHPIWKLGAASTYTVTKAAVKAKLLVQRYPLYYSRTAGVNYGQLCPLCHNAEETMEHFLETCPALQQERVAYTSRIHVELSALHIHIPTGVKMCQVILDPSFLCRDQPAAIATLEALTRDLCFSLHLKRTHILSNGSTATGPSEVTGNDDPIFVCDEDHSASLQTGYM